MSARSARLPVIALAALWSCVALAADVPYLTGRVVDNANILSGGAKQKISQLAEAREKATGDQIAVLTMPSLDGESIEGFATHTDGSRGGGKLVDVDNAGSERRGGGAGGRLGHDGQAQGGEGEGEKEFFHGDRAMLVRIRLKSREKKLGAGSPVVSLAARNRRHPEPGEGAIGVFAVHVMMDSSLRSE